MNGLIDVIICAAIFVVVAFTIGVIYYVGGRLITGIINSIKCFIRWHRKLDDDFYYDNQRKD